MAATQVDHDGLREWYQDYMAEKGNSLNVESSLIRSVASDDIDPPYIEDQIKQTMSTTHVTGGHCERCLHLFNHWPNLGKESWTHEVGRSYRTREIEAAARLGCKSCSLFLTRLKVTGMLDTFRRLEKRMDLLNESATASISISNWSTDDVQLVWFNWPGKVATSCNCSSALHTKFQTHVVNPSAYREDDRTSFDLARDWLRTCSEEHPPCNEDIQLKRPTRLVSVAGDTVKLVSTADMETLPRYATLSYCWGASDMEKSTFNTFSSSRDMMLYDDLPKTFRDAIDIVREIGLDYIWIDALCIIETMDSNEDWLRESGQMRDIYGGTFVNIAAASATNSHVGCFTKSADYSGGFLARVETDEWCRTQVFHASEVYAESTLNTHLATRAWTFQEKLLAPRTIYWGDQGLFWECRTTIASDFVPDGLPDLFTSRMVRPVNEKWDWFGIVQNYSKGNLTRPSDKLTALSGIARRQHEVDTELGEYLAGLWKKHFVRQLGWKAVTKTKKSEWRAPSWSWMAVDGEVHLFPYWNDPSIAADRYVEVLHVSTTPAGPDPFGSITIASLRVSCSAMVRARYVESAGPKDPEAEWRGDDLVTLGAERRRYPVLMDYWDDVPGEVGTQVYLLPLYGGESGMATTGPETPDEDASEERNWIKEHMIRGLVLRDTLASGKFVRVGWFDFRDMDMHSDIENASELAKQRYDAFVRVLGEEGASTAADVCLERLVDTGPLGRRYVITLD